MQKNARGYVQDSCEALSHAISSLENALQTVEKDSNRQRIEQSLQYVEQAMAECNATESILEQR